MPDIIKIPFAERMATAEKEIQAVLAKYEVDIVATLAYGKFSTVAQISFVDSLEGKKSTNQTEATKTTQG